MHLERTRLLKNKQVDYFEAGQVVLVGVPKKFRSSLDMLWVRKAGIVEEQTDIHGNSLFKWKVRWLETGDLSKSEKPYTVSSYFLSRRDLKPFCFGNDRLVEFGLVHDAPERIDYTAEDVSEEEAHLLVESNLSESNDEVTNKTSISVEDVAYLDMIVDCDS